MVRLLLCRKIRNSAVRELAEDVTYRKIFKKETQSQMRRKKNFDINQIIQQGLMPKFLDISIIRLYFLHYIKYSTLA